MSSEVALPARSLLQEPLQLTSQNGIQVECTANSVPVPKASLSLKDKYEVYDLLLNALGKRKRDAYLLNPDVFDQGYFMVPFDLTAVQDGGESSTPLLRNAAQHPSDLQQWQPHSSKPCFSIIRTRV